MKIDVDWLILSCVVAQVCHVCLVILFSYTNKTNISLSISRLTIGWDANVQNFYFLLLLFAGMQYS